MSKERGEKSGKGGKKKVKTIKIWEERNRERKQEKSKDNNRRKMKGKEKTIIKERKEEKNKVGQ